METPMNQKSTQEEMSQKGVLLGLKKRSRIVLLNGNVFLSDKYNISETGVWAVGYWLFEEALTALAKYENLIRPEKPQKAMMAKERFCFFPNAAISCIDMDYDVLKETPGDSPEKK